MSYSFRAVQLERLKSDPYGQSVRIGFLSPFAELHSGEPAPLPALAFRMKLSPAEHLFASFEAAGLQLREASGESGANLAN